MASPQQISHPAPQSSSPIKKPQPIPWTHQETLALIQAYQQKWYSLNKGQLKAFQWEHVVLSVASLCGLKEPSKTSTQCRHKIEKLRKRYRQECTKPYPDSWQYFQVMDQMERGPNAPVVYYNRVSNVPVNVNVNANGTRFVSNSSRGGGESESDEEWSVSNSKRSSKSKSINNIVRNSNEGGNGNVVANEGNERFVGVLRDRRSGKRKDFYYSSEDEDVDGYINYNEFVGVEEKDEDVVEEEEEEDEGKGVGRELAKEIMGFAESFLRLESGKIEMMREKERRRMEMEKKRMEMIIGAQRKVVETIGRAFGTDKKPKMG